MALLKDVKGFGLPWEESYGFAQAVKVGDTIYVSGQLGLDDQGKMIYSNMETQMRQTYANAKKILSQFGATLENVVEEVLMSQTWKRRSPQLAQSGRKHTRPKRPQWRAPLSSRPDFHCRLS